MITKNNTAQQHSHQRGGAIRRVALLLLLVLSITNLAHAARLRDLVEVQGARGNMLKGIGIVIGLAGTGDSAAAAVTAQQRLLERLNIDIESLKELSSKNAAVVMVTATLPAFAKEGTRIDVKIDSLYDCESLEGGMLLETHLMGPGLGETVYALAQGPVSTGGFNADGGGGTSVRKNHVTSGRVPMGAYVEREVPSTITDGERIMLLLKRPDFSVAHEIEQAINTQYGSDSAAALGAGSIRVTIPEQERAGLVQFIADLEEISVTTGAPSRVVINERTGTIVVGGQVIIKPCQVAHGNLTIKIASTPQVAQALPFTDASPVVTESVEVDVLETEAHFMPIEGTSAGEVAATLNKLRVSPRDMIAIFQALREAGALEADLEVM